MIGLAPVGTTVAVAGSLGFKPEDAEIAGPTPSSMVFEVEISKQTYFGGSVEVVVTILGRPGHALLSNSVVGRS